MSSDPRQSVGRRWYASRVYCAWVNRCWRCLLDPCHGDDRAHNAGTWEPSYAYSESRPEAASADRNTAAHLDESVVADHERRIKALEGLAAEQQRMTDMLTDDLTSRGRS